MRSMKSRLGMLSLLALSMMDTSNDGMGFHSPKETHEERERRIYETELKLAKSRGLKEFHYGIKSVFAVNQRVADKKAMKMGIYNSKQAT